MPTLIRRGSRGKDVEILQKCLDQLFPLKRPSILRPDGRADGIFGPQTQAWVEEFQRVQPVIKDDGVVGPITWQKLKNKLPLNFSGRPTNEIEKQKAKKISKEDVWDHWSVEQEFYSLSAEKRNNFYDDLSVDLHIRNSSVLRFIGNNKLFIGGNTVKLFQVVELFGVLETSVAWFALGGPTSVFITGISSTLAWYGAITTNTDMYAVRAWAYTVTAWAMGKRRPLSSPYMMHKFEDFSSPGKVELRRQAWDKMSRKTWIELESMHMKYGKSKKMMQLFIQLLADKQPRGSSIEQKICYRLLTSRISDFYGSRTKEDNWKQGYDVLYPK